MKKFLQNFKSPKGFLGFNFNLGCPSPEIIKRGLGCASIKRISKIQKNNNEIKDQEFNVSIKIRLGMNQFEKDKKYI